MRPSVVGEEYAVASERSRPRRAYSGLGVAVVAMALLGAVQALPTSAAPTPRRLAGPDRYATAAAISQATFSPGVPAAYVATGEDFPDALAGGPAAALAGGPVLLTSRAGVPEATARELARLRPGRVVVLGGPAAVPDAVARGLESLTSPPTTVPAPSAPATATTTGPATTATTLPSVTTTTTQPSTTTALPTTTTTTILTTTTTTASPTAGLSSRAAPLQAATGVERVAGPDRYATAAAVSAAAFAPGVAVAYVATGAAFPDALAAGPVAARERGPVLLTAPGALPPATAAELARLRPREVVVLGGPAAVSAVVEGQLRAYTGAITRLAGPDRYATAVAVARRFPPPVGAVFLATGANFPDALAGGPAAATAGAPLLLVPGTCAPADVRAEVDRLAPPSLVVLGGPAAVAPAVEGLAACAPPAVGTIPTTTTPSQAGATPGAFCAPEGATATTSTGEVVVCTRTPTDDRARWRAAAASATTTTTSTSTTALPAATSTTAAAATTMAPAGPPGQAGVTPGAFCSPEGASGVTSTGWAMVCTRAPTDDRARWRAAA